jgi:hypothetical protein
MRRLDILGELANFIKEWFSFMKKRKRWWLAPLIILIALLSLLIVIAEASAIAPFIYALF